MQHSLHPGTNSACRQCLGGGIVVEPLGEFAVAGACSCIGECGVCRGTGFVPVSDGFRAARKRCACRALVTRLKAFNDARIPARHAASTRMNFDKSGSRMQGFLAVTRFVESWSSDGENRGLVLHGGVGKGKTHLMAALVRELVFRQGLTARFVEFSHLLADLKSGFDTGRGASVLIDPLVHVDLLAIDELGKGRNTEFEATVVDELISRRYNAMLPIVATSNYAPGRARGREVPNLAARAPTDAVPMLVDRLGERVYSRLCETVDFCEVRGRDFRQEGRGRTSLG